MGMTLILGQLHSTVWQLMMPTFAQPDFLVLDWLAYLCVQVDLIMAVGWAPLAVPPKVAARVLRVCLRCWCDCSLFTGEWLPL